MGLSFTILVKLVLKIVNRVINLKSNWYIDFPAKAVKPVKSAFSDCCFHVILEKRNDLSRQHRIVSFSVHDIEPIIFLPKLNVSTRSSLDCLKTLENNVSKIFYIHVTVDVSDGC